MLCHESIGGPSGHNLSCRTARGLSTQDRRAANTPIGTGANWPPGIRTPQAPPRLDRVAEAERAPHGVLQKLQNMAPVVLPRYAVQFMGLPNPARCASLAGKGLLRIDATHWLSVVVPSLCTPAAVAGGDRVIPHREVSYILLAAGFSALDPELVETNIFKDKNGLLSLT